MKSSTSLSLGSYKLTRTNIAAGIVIVAALLCAACGSENQASQPTMTTPGAQTPTAATTVVPKFFESLATSDPRTMRSALRLASPGSPAATFATHQRQLALASSSDNSSQDITFTTSADDQTAIWGTSINNTASTTEEFSNFQFDQAGLLTTWTINNTKLLARQIRKLSLSHQAEGIRFKLSTRYLSADNQLQITYSGSSAGDSGDIDVSGYITPNKKRKSPTNIPYRLDIDRRSRSVGASFINQAPTRGHLIVEFDYDTKAQMIIP